MMVKFNYKTLPVWDALKNDTFPVSGFSNFQGGRKGESRGDLGEVGSNFVRGIG